MKRHTTLGRDAISKGRNPVRRLVELPALRQEIAYSHQEKWDGSGYPRASPANASRWPPA